MPSPEQVAQDGPAAHEPDWDGLLNASDRADMEAGALAGNTWYTVFAVAKAGGADPARLASTSSSSPTMPTGYTVKRRIGAFRTDGSAQVIDFKQNGDWFQWVTSRHDVDDASGNTTSRTLRTMSVAPGVKCRVKFRAFVPDAADSVTIFQDPDEADAAPNNAMTTPGGSLRNSSQSQPISEPEIQTNASQQIASRCSVSGKPLDIVTYGYWDHRGRND